MAYNGPIFGTTRVSRNLSQHSDLQEERSRNTPSLGIFNEERRGRHSSDALAVRKPPPSEAENILHEVTILSDRSSHRLFENLLKRLALESNGDYNSQQWTDRDVSEYTVGPRRTGKKLRYEDYTVCWICALPEEMVAAKAMLDEIHAPLPNPPGDYNAYHLGAIGHHNVVITAIRSGIYGTTSATATAVTLHTTYPNSDIMPLLVGIGGGVPRPDSNDVRLGDVVIGSPSPEHEAVVQHDYGKITTEGIIDRKGSLNKPAPALLSALSNFRSELSLRPTRITEYMRKALEDFPSLTPGFLRPDAETDILMGNHCHHVVGSSDCPACPVRKPRDHDHSEVHFGCIASGNQVIKHAPTRDRIAGSAVLCFEMEAAGILDYLPCLVVRGICDYCDAHKTKGWQKYAALAAAAVAKDLLSLAPFYAWKDPSDKDPKQKGRMKEEQLQERSRLLSALDYEYSSTRLATVKRAHSQTCLWLLSQPQILEWLDPGMHPKHHGLLWMKGKPGAGKSTAMKYLVEQAEASFHNSQVTVVSFFFSARGAYLGRSTIGMYRAILGQIFRRLPILQSLLDRQRPEHVPIEFFTWTLESLQDLLTKVVKSLGRMHLMCYIDALDECPEDQIREMVDHLEHITELAEANHLHVCFASRHYPHVSIKTGCEFVLELQHGHAKDILDYLDAELVLGRDKLAANLRRRAFEKSGQIFLWIVLVVRILKREYDRGGIHKLRGLLDTIPTEVDELFRDILTRDSENLPQLVTIIRWVLYAKRPMTPIELYYAVLSTGPSPARGSYQDSELKTQDMERYLLSSSKGLMETTRSDKATVQFIHETVREFLLQPGVLVGLWPDFEGISEGPSHKLLAQYCLQELIQYAQRTVLYELTTHASSSAPFEPAANKFSRYAIEHQLHHAEEAERLGQPQGEYLTQLANTPWLVSQIYRAAVDRVKTLSGSVDLPALNQIPELVTTNSSRDSQRHANKHLGNGTWYEKNLVDSLQRLGYVLSSMVEGQNLLERWLRLFINDIEWSKGMSRLLIMLVCTGNWPGFRSLTIACCQVRNKVTPSTSVRPIYNLLIGLLVNKPERFNDKLRPLIDFLIQEGSHPDQILGTALILAAYAEDAAAVRTFLQLGANVNHQTDDGSTAMHLAILSSPRAEVKSSKEYWQTIRRPRWSNASKLLQGAVRQTTSGFQGPVYDELWTSLTRTNPPSDSSTFERRLMRSELCILEIMSAGADITIRDKRGRTPLGLAMECGAVEGEAAIRQHIKRSSQGRIGSHMWRWSGLGVD